MARLGPLKFGMSSALGSEISRAQAHRFAWWLEGRLGAAVTVTLTESYQDLARLLAAGDVDLAWMPPVAFVEAISHGAHPLVTPLRRGLLVYESALIVPHASPVRSLDDLPGSVAAWVDRDSTSGYLYAAAEILLELGALDTVFDEQRFMGSHGAVCDEVGAGRATVGATFARRDAEGVVVEAGWLDQPPGGAAKVRPIHFIGPIPQDALAMQPGLAPATCEFLARELAHMALDPEGAEILEAVFAADEMVPTRLELYEPLRLMLQYAWHARS